MDILKAFFKGFFAMALFMCIPTLVGGLSAYATYSATGVVFFGVIGFLIAAAAAVVGLIAAIEEYV